MKGRYGFKYTYLVFNIDDLRKAFENKEALRKVYEDLKEYRKWADYHRRMTGTESQFVAVRQSVLFEKVKKWLEILGVKYEIAELEELKNTKFVDIVESIERAVERGEIEPVVIDTQPDP